jgi:hypothetical protein
VLIRSRFFCHSLFVEFFSTLMYYALFSTFSIELFVVNIVISLSSIAYDTILCFAGFSGLWSILLALGAHRASCSWWLSAWWCWMILIRARWGADWDVLDVVWSTFMVYHVIFYYEILYYDSLHDRCDGVVRWSNWYRYSYFYCSMRTSDLIPDCHGPRTRIRDSPAEGHS